MSIINTTLHSTSNLFLCITVYCYRRMSITVDQYHQALLHAEAVTIHYYRLLAIVSYCLIIVTRYSTASFLGTFFIPRANQALISTIGILISGCSALFDAHLFILQPGKQGTWRHFAYGYTARPRGHRLIF